MKEFNIEERLMGSRFKLGVLADNNRQAEEWLQVGITEIKRIELLLSEFIDQSETSKINNAKKDIPNFITKETYQLIARAQTISKLTNGDFDITVAPLKKLYQFKNERIQMPNQ